MYSFAQRDDTVVYDEPLHAHYLSKTPAREYHPGAEEVIATMENDGEKVVRDIILGDQPNNLLYLTWTSQNQKGLTCLEKQNDVK